MAPPKKFDYWVFYHAFCAANSCMSGTKQQLLANRAYESICHAHDKCAAEVTRMKKRSKQSSIIEYFKPKSVIDDNMLLLRETDSEIIEVDQLTSADKVNQPTFPRDATSQDVPTTDKKVATPAQDALNQEISDLRRKLLVCKDGIRILGKTAVREDEEKQYQKLLNRAEARLTKLSKNGLRVKDYRKRATGGIAKKRGRKPANETRPGLDAVTVDITTAGVHATDERRRFTALVRHCTTLDELLSEVRKQAPPDWPPLSRSTLYYRLKAPRKNTREGARHACDGPPVRLLKPQHDKHKYHADFHFTCATVNMVAEVLGLVGQNMGLFLSRDDKAKVPLGIPAASKQQAVLMHLDYPVRLPDHTFVIGNRHRLVPSVIAVCKMRESKDSKLMEVRNSGPTLIHIRSDKHDRSTPLKHMYDIQQAIQSFPNETKVFVPDKHGNHVQMTKPVVSICVDNATDQRPLSMAVLRCAIMLFRGNDLDALFLISYAPGNSAFNKVERRMAPLSKRLAGLIVPHNLHGDHLNSAGETVEPELEYGNFGEAGTFLAEHWSAMGGIDGYEVIARYVNSTHEYITPPTINYAWLMRHCRCGLYIIQLVRCSDRKCCKPWKSTYPDHMPLRFLPAPTPLVKGPFGLVPAESDKTSDAHYHGLLMQLHCAQRVEARDIPFDKYCPTASMDVHRLTCADCEIYYPSNRLFKSHKNACRKRHAPGGFADVGNLSSPDVSDDEDELLLRADGVREIDGAPKTNAGVLMNVDAVAAFFNGHLILEEDCLEAADNRTSA